MDPEDEVETVGTQASRASQASTRRGTGVATPAERREEKGQGQGQEKEEQEEVEVEAEEQQQEQEEEENNNVVHRRPSKHIGPRERQRDGDLEREWRHHRDKGRHPVLKPQPKELEAGEEIEEEAVRSGRRLSWIRTGPEEPGRKGQRPREPGPKLSKSALLFPQKSSLSALTSRAKQILTNSAHAVPRSPADTHPRTKDHKRDPNKIYITRPRPAKDRKAPLSRQPREVFPGVFLYQTGKTTRLVNLGAKARGGPLLPKPPPKAIPANHSKLAALSPHGPASRAAVLSHTDSRRATPGTPKVLPHTTMPHLHAPPPPPSTGPAPNSSWNTSLVEARVTSYMRTSEITEPQKHKRQEGEEQQDEEEDEQEQEPQPEPDPEQQDQDQDQERDQDQEQGQGTVPEEEGGLSEYSYEDAEPRPGWAEESINWQRTFSVNTMDFELLRSDWNDLRCNVSGNLQLAESEVVDVLAQYMEKLNERNGG